MTNERNPTQRQQSDTAEGHDPTEDQEKLQKIAADADAIAAEHDAHEAEIAERVGKIHQIADIAAVARHREKPLEDGSMDRDIRQIEAKAHKDHEGKRPNRA